MSKYYITSTAFLVVFIVSLSMDGTLGVPSWWYYLLVSVYGSITLAGAIFLSFGYFFEVKQGGSPGKAAITIDLAEDSSNVMAMLDLLMGSGVPAAFFCTGKFLSANPELAQEIARQGHVIGSMGYWKGRLFCWKSSSMISRELSETEAPVFAITGKRLRFFRPPFGLSSPMLAKAVSRRNYKVIGWKIDLSSETRFENISKLIAHDQADGAIIRLDGGNKQVVSMLDSLIRHLLDRKMTLVRVDELVNEKAFV